MLVRWIAAGLQDAHRSFRRIRGCGEIPALIRALDRQRGHQEGGRIDDRHPSRRSRSGDQFNSERDIPQNPERISYFHLN